MAYSAEDFSVWDTGALITVPPESLEVPDLMALVIELQNRLGTLHAIKNGTFYVQAEEG